MYGTLVTWNADRSIFIVVSSEPALQHGTQFWQEDYVSARFTIPTGVG